MQCRLRLQDDSHALILGLSACGGCTINLPIEFKFAACPGRAGSDGNGGFSRFELAAQQHVLASARCMCNHVGSCALNIEVLLRIACGVRNNRVTNVNLLCM
jgi:hypothetical protein